MLTDILALPGLTNHGAKNMLTASGYCLFIEYLIGGAPGGALIGANISTIYGLRTARPWKDMLPPPLRLIFRIEPVTELLRYTIEPCGALTIMTSAPVAPPLYTVYERF